MQSGQQVATTGQLLVLLPPDSPLFTIYWVHVFKIQVWTVGGAFIRAGAFVWQNTVYKTNNGGSARGQFGVRLIIQRTQLFLSSHSSFKHDLLSFYVSVVNAAHGAIRAIV